jgi:hypothetical protein
VGGDVPIDSEAILVTDFINLKIKSAQSFGGAHKNRMYMHVFMLKSTVGSFADQPVGSFADGPVSSFADGPSALLPINRRRRTPAMNPGTERRRRCFCAA